MTSSMNSEQALSHKQPMALIADDDVGIQITLRALLEQKGYAVTAVGNGLDAVNALSKDEFNIILLDIRMPRMNGFEACRSIRVLEIGKHLPILMLTGQDDNESIEKAFEVGATDFVAKPINFALMGFRIDYIARAATIAKELRKAQKRAAYYDDLTGLPNRSLLIQHLDRILKSAIRHQTTTAVIVFGINRFDKVLESLDHDSVENLIKIIAERVKNPLRESDVLSHQAYSGESGEEPNYQQLTAKLRNDEYVIVLPEISNPQAASVFLLRLMEQFKNAFQLSDQIIYLSTSAGISLAPIDGNSTNQLIKFAEIARGFVENKEVGGFRFFKQELNDQVTRRSLLVNDLRKALKQETLEVHYQPKIRLLDNALVGVEALCRWNHPTLGAISPVEFIEIAEAEGLIAELGMWVLKTACNQSLEWKGEFDNEFIVSVNISPQQLVDEEAMKQIFEYVSISPIENRFIEFELTESSFLENFETSLKVLNQFIKMGCGLAIDDFGTGYSSLSYLGQLPAKTLKIDRSFIHPIDSNNRYTAIVRGIIKLSHSLGMSVIAEGVETTHQKAILAQEQCDEIQGYLVSRPLSVTDFRNWLNSWENQNLDTDSESGKSGSIT
jgi:predicted signal transduction protein with EAL and GGDEF domain